MKQGEDCDVHRARLFVLAGGLLAACVVPRPSGAEIPIGRWVPGDLDLHSTYSDDVCGMPPVPVSTSVAPGNCDANGDGLSAPPTNAGWSAIELVTEAEKRGLQFVAITDRDVPATIGAPSAQTDPEILQYKANHEAHPDQYPVLILDGVEQTLVDATGAISGRVSAVAYRGPGEDALGPFPVDHNSADGWTAEDLDKAIAKVHGDHPEGRAAGMVFANRPANPAFGGDGHIYDSIAGSLDGWQVWNGAYFDQSEFTGTAAADDPQADAMWMTLETTLTASGKRLPIVGGSDAHYRYAAQFDGPGRPTLWVWDTLDDPTAPATWTGIRDAIASGRTMLGFAPPGDRGPMLSLETVDGNYMEGDTLPDTPSHQYQVRVIWQNAPVGAKIRIVGIINSNPVRVGAVPFTITTTTTDGFAAGPSLQFLPGRWYRAELYIDDDPVLPAPGAPTRSGLQCMPSWPTNNPCLKDRYLMMAITGPMFAPAPAA